MDDTIKILGTFKDPKATWFSASDSAGVNMKWCGGAGVK